MFTEQILPFLRDLRAVCEKHNVIIDAGEFTQWIEGDTDQRFKGLLVCRGLAQCTDGASKYTDPPQ